MAAPKKPAQQSSFSHGLARTGSALASIVLLAALWVIPAASHLSAGISDADHGQPKSKPTAKVAATKTLAAGLGKVHVSIVPVDLTKLPKSAFGD